MTAVAVAIGSKSERDFFSAAANLLAEYQMSAKAFQDSECASCTGFYPSAEQAPELWVWCAYAIATQYSPDCLNGRRVDFLLRKKVGTCIASLAVEIDGDEHLLKTNADIDRAKEAKLLIAEGIPTMRFSNRQIAIDCDAAVYEAFDFLDEETSRRSLDQHFAVNHELERRGIVDSNWREINPVDVVPENAEA